MPRILRWTLAALAVLALLVWYFLFTAVAVPEKARFALDLAALRAAAGPEDALPEKARADLVAQADFPALGVVAGEGLRTLTFGFYCWQLVYPDGSTAVLDPVHSPQVQAKNYPKFPYHPDAWERQVRALAGARTIAVTHEHHDHIGGIYDAPDLEALRPKLKLTAAQRAEPPFGGLGRALGGAPTLESGPEGSLHPIAPGLVAISAAGHTPGSQLIYARLKGGAELLLIGDVAWQRLALDRARTRPRLTSLVMHEDAVAVTNQLRAVLDFQRANPSVDVVVAHDVAEMERRFQSGAVGRGLQ